MEESRESLRYQRLSCHLWQMTYIGVCLIIVFTHVPQVPAAFAEIRNSQHFGLKAVAGGAIGAMTVCNAERVLQEESSLTKQDLGSAPIAARTAAQTNEPVRQGLVIYDAESFIDTIIVMVQWTGPLPSL